MKMDKISAAIVLLATPLAAHASIPDTGIYALVGGAVGGFAGALLACWLCKRFGPKSGTDSKKY